jgi:transcriptional regulator with XRE-family HTH domain
MEKNIEIGKRIKQRREELGMTQEELGNLLWLNKSTIQRYEAGKIAKIKLPVIHAMAKQLNVSPEWLILHSDEMGSFHERFDLYKDGKAETVSLTLVKSNQTKTL